MKKELGVTVGDELAPYIGEQFRLPVAIALIVILCAVHSSQGGFLP